MKGKTKACKMKTAENPSEHLVVKKKASFTPSKLQTLTLCSCFLCASICNYEILFLTFTHQ